MTTTITIGADDWTALGAVPSEGTYFRFHLVNVDTSTGRLRSEQAWLVETDAAGVASTTIPDAVIGNGLVIQTGLKGLPDTTVAGYPTGAISLIDLLSYAVDPATLAPAEAPAAWWAALEAAQLGTGPGGGTGPQGPQGPLGAQGPAGATGPKGDTGSAGTAGAQGIPGVKGDTGAAGATGATGAKGDTGNTGPAGATGAAGTNAPPIGTTTGTAQDGGVYTDAIGVLKFRKVTTMPGSPDPSIIYVVVP